ncbi:hypothetical protein C5E45_03630 [Nocardia nova]|uniref:HTH tetR-type domain-containing protein n=1 Tax=Nocardia nova TaxID=37330 RepID=A0A2S6AWF9_9NOCA|nr:hypothetical protein C5E41_02550 [Nocardia nova]PPJ39551.1 hypothetical protein C5E45_03630 [Nocardia nova]
MEGSVEAAERFGPRALRTRSAILVASERLFLELGYGGTRINNITDACGISPAGFYTYFRGKREVFEALGEAAYRDLLEVVGEIENLPRPCSASEMETWVRRYFALMDRHGAFIFAAPQAGPADESIEAAVSVRPCATAARQNSTRWADSSAEGELPAALCRANTAKVSSNTALVSNSTCSLPMARTALRSSSRALSKPGAPASAIALSPR